MKIRPLENYHLLGTSIRLDSSKTYKAIHATNQPDWKAKGIIFALLPGTMDDSFMLESGEYEIIEK